jgi:UDP-N-acetylmuramoyl-L-alanyl-D-glutamate--2,6-diaminopimelate ligase
VTEGSPRVLLLDLLDGITPLHLTGDPAVDVRAVEYDSRRVGPGACFACIPGQQVDGHAFAPDAVAAGAVALLVERPLGLGVAEVRVPAVRAALGPVAARAAGDPSRHLRCLGVTGTNGKTTTTYLLQAVAAAAGERAGIIGTTGSRIDGAVVPVGPDGVTTPEAPDLQGLLARMRADGVTTVAMEVSSHGLAQHRVDGTWFTAACFTNLSRDHLDFHGTMAAYFEAKARLFVPERCGIAVTNLDDDHGCEIARRAAATGVPLVTYAVDDPTADLTVTDLDVRATGTGFVLHDRRAGERVAVALALPGPHNVWNALAAAATARAIDVPLAAVAAGLAATPPVPGRFERVEAGQSFTVLVDYAHTPDALARAVASARALAGSGRVAVVFGCGGDRDPDKRGPMGAAAAVADLVVVTTDNPRSEDPAAIAAAAATGVRAVGAVPVVVPDRRAAIATALDWAAPGDVVLVAGKGHETGQTAGGVTVAFDDRVVARTLLEERV